MNDWKWNAKIKELMKFEHCQGHDPRGKTVYIDVDHISSVEYVSDIFTEITLTNGRMFVVKGYLLDIMNILSKGE